MLHICFVIYLHAFGKGEILCLTMQQGDEQSQMYATKAKQTYAQASAVPSLNHLMTYYSFLGEGEKIVCEKLSGEQLRKHSSYTQAAANLDTVLNIYSV